MYNIHTYCIVCLVQKPITTLKISFIIRTSGSALTILPPGNEDIQNILEVEPQPKSKQ